MTNTEITQALMNDYLDCVFRSASPDPKPQPKHFTEVPEGITLTQLYLVNTNWGSNSLLRITLNRTELDAMTAHRALIRYGHLKVSSFVENHVYINDVKDK